MIKYFSGLVCWFQTIFPNADDRLIEVRFVFSSARAAEIAKREIPSSMNFGCVPQHYKEIRIIGIRLRFLYQQPSEGEV